MLCCAVLLQASALQNLQKRFDTQEHELAAATATAVGTKGSEGVQVEPYFPEEKVQQELTMLHKVEAQIEAVSKSVDEATKALPGLTREQQLVQVSITVYAQHCSSSSTAWQWSARAHACILGASRST